MAGAAQALFPPVLTGLAGYSFTRSLRRASAKLWDDRPIPDEPREVDPPSMEGIAILLGSSVGVLSVLGGVLILIAKLTGGADEQ